MSSIQKMIGLSLLLMSLQAQASVTDTFCIQEDPSCFSSSNIQPPIKSPPNFNAIPTVNKEQCVEVKGSATQEGVTKDFARKMAIRDALKMASLKSNLTVKTDQSIEQFQLTLDSARFTSSSKVKSFTVIEEGDEDSEDIYGQSKKEPLNYEVTINACLTEELGVCASLTGNQYQARIAVAPIVMTREGEARDISNLLFGYQKELERRIKNRGYRNFILLKEPIDIQPNLMIAPNLDLALLDGVRDRTGAQYLLLTVIRSLSTHSNNGVLNDIKVFYSLEVKPDSRFIESDWYLVDLMSHTVVHQARGGFDIKGDVTVGRNKPFGTNAFFSTDTGLAFHALLESQVTNVLEFLHCKPFESQVIDVRNGEYIIYLNASSGAKVGDDLAVYHRIGRPVRFNGVLLGSDQQPGAFLKIKRILPNFAITELSAKKGNVQIGDIVKTW
ncbi:MAG: hypothetical protein ISEC1_P0065 [Thiomicrorhabdus sp.]|nr:MAG: hypothetical protein ISEC1_P0065 [Thiomicrorhabdus sp.]